MADDGAAAAMTAFLASGIQGYALTQGERVPSTRFRVVQHLEGLERLGHALQHLPARHGAYPPFGLARRAAWLPAAGADALRRAWRARRSPVLLQRELVSTLQTAEPLLRGPLVFDVDDAIFLHARGARTDAIARRARLVICGNSFLADHYSALAPVTILPTAVDTERFVPPTTRPDPEAPVIGWSGSSSGFPYLESIAPALARVLALHPRAVFEVMAERAPQLRGLPPERVRFVPWSERDEVRALQGYSVGIMPLFDDPWARGKCSFKMLTYMACGLPVVVSPVGMNREVLALGAPAALGLAASALDDWVQALDQLLRAPEAAAAMGRRGREVAEQVFARNVITPRLAALLTQVAA
jgi:glycosyltransferase involved in cell wall biosynthesis